MELILYLEILPLLAVVLVEHLIMVRQALEVLVADKVKFLYKGHPLVKELLVKETLVVLVLVRRVVLVTMAVAVAAVLELLV
jgi:hypothetical protein